MKTAQELAVQRDVDRQSFLSCFDGKSLGDRVVRALLSSAESDSVERAVALAIKRLCSGENLTDSEREALVSAGGRGVFACKNCKGSGMTSHSHGEWCNSGGCGGSECCDNCEGTGTIRDLAKLPYCEDVCSNGNACSRREGHPPIHHKWTRIVKTSSATAIKARIDAWESHMYWFRKDQPEEVSRCEAHLEELRDWLASK